MSKSRDRIFADPLSGVEQFKFDDRVAAVFPDMIRRSVPGYATVIGMLGVFAERFVADGSTVYDLGCSLGAATTVMRSAVGHTQCRFVAVDSAPAMVKRATEILDALPGAPVSVHCADIRDTEIENASFTVMNYTLQFIPLLHRLPLLRKIRAGTRNGGALVISEKIAGRVPDEDARLVTMHHAFKRANGYSDLEISRKRAALERVLIPETVDAHCARLRHAGFSQVDLWFQCCNFVSLIAYT